MMTTNEQRSIEYLNRVKTQLHRYKYHELLVDLKSLVPSLPIIIGQTDKLYRIKHNDPWAYDPSILYRARENTNLVPAKSSMKMPFKLVHEISIIPEEKKQQIKTFGRCNKPTSPRFYASNHFPAACIESITSGFSKERSGNLSATVGIWKIVEPLWVSQVNFSKKALLNIHSFDPTRYDKIIEYTEWMNQKNTELIISNQNAFSQEYAIAILDFFSEEFAKMGIKTENDYMLTNYYCDHVFERTLLEDGKTMIDAIIYPSTSFAYQEWNTVIHPRAMHKLKFLSAMQVWITHDENTGQFQFSPLEQQVHADETNSLQWRNFAW